MKKLAITLVIVIGLLVAADFGAAAIAEYQVSKKMRQQLALNEDPSVRINGFPFLYQAAVGDFRDVQLAAQAVKVGQLSEVGIEADLHHARVSTPDVVAGKADRIQVDELVGRVKLKASDVGRFIGITDLTINPAPKDALTSEDGSSDGSGDAEQSGPSSTVDRTRTTVQLDGSVNIAGEQTKVKVIAVLSLLNGQLKIEPRKLDIVTGSYGEIPLPEVFERSVLEQFNTSLDPGLLPFEVTPTAVGVERGALIVEGSAANVTIGPGGMTTG
ncbi:DUF2993 domain-containing protein [Saccharopolyspora erythraea]|uniref:LmeA family phospholipid-binding protein n=1 Tax=Saccharopolyspora erythraea TaxID=1836 RepID=UPI001BAB286E|nr:DUF2993 domain-containing protein [Saccharopolyspora erythraea]QUH05426.1 DUF2993 domain-containing protein [Saccharopolyspora erythraea]